MRTTETEAQFTPRYHAVIHNTDEKAEAVLDHLIGPSATDDPWDFVSLADFEDVESAVKEVNRLHKRYSLYMKKKNEDEDGMPFSWFSMEMELRPGLYTLIYWPGRSVGMEEIKSAAADAWLSVQGLTANRTRH